MGIFQKKLEKEQLIMFRFVEIGTDLFAMASCLSRAESLLAANNGRHSSQDLADLFCQNAERRIKKAFVEIKNRQSKIIHKVSTSVLDGNCNWLEDGVIKKIE